ncbi:MAG: DNA topoisomerase I [Caldisphaeraceae archaeon]|nr:DNA topoisomerase I [Caldisphaeraceae archaeon]MEB3692396.1 DNA topoisomerase I [Caldisphaeraceae archaeon]MEB3797548.1 DNA topoisomerase I [Caldisphaeraceae archaeon]
MRRFKGQECFVPKKFVALIAEKPKAAERIAYALSSLGKYKKCRLYGIPYWIINKDGSSVLVLPSAGHLFGPSTKGRGLPITKIRWRPIHEFDRSAYYTKPYYKLMQRFIPLAESYINACDYDIEGSVIGYKIIEELGDPKKALRMKFSTLTKEDVIEAFHKIGGIDKENVRAGEARHELDWLWGINISRLLMKIIKDFSGKKISLSAGRVQTPTLAEAVRRWKEINLYLPIPFIQIEIVGEYEGRRFFITTKDWYPQSVSEARGLLDYLNENPILTTESFKEFGERINPPPAFNLGDLQREASRIYGFSPFRTQGIAERLYLEALISYPRTNSQKLPKSINYGNIMKKLEGQRYYSSLVNELLRETLGRLKPVEGKEEDPAHPAIYPTGEFPKGRLDKDYFRVYDLITRRFLATFSKSALINNRIAVFVDGKNRKYKAEGLIVIEDGWYKYYKFSYPKEKEIPALKVGDEVKVVHASYRLVWPRCKTSLSKSSLLKWMERVNIGTKATRARTIEILYKRKYLSLIEGKSEVTELGYSVLKAIELISKELTSPELTRKFEEKLDKIYRESAKKDDIINEAKEFLVKIVKEKIEDKNIGNMIAKAIGLVRPEVRCSVCGREAKHNIAGNPLCEFHYEALKRIEDNLEVLSKKIEKNRNEVLKELVKNPSSGKWIKEASAFLLKRND